MRRFLQVTRHYLLFFLLTAFLVTCCVSLFVDSMVKAMDVSLTASNLEAAAKLTFANVILLSLIFTLIDVLRRKLTVNRTTQQIADAARQIVSGDFSARVAPVNRFVMDENFNVIIDCFNRMARELSSVETLRSDFISNVSHEMKTPLSVMQNYATLLLRSDLSSEKRQEYTQAIVDASRRLSDMTTNILKLNKLENQQIFLHQEKYDLGEQLCEALLQYENVWDEKRIEIETKLAEDVVIRADRELMLLVWNNLLSNAFKFTPNGGTVRLLLSANEQYAVITVEDTGCGMSAETGAHIFEKFYQGDPSHTAKGNGLGLALVKRIVDIVGGEIEVRSTPGQGARFTVTIARNL